MGLVPNIYEKVDRRMEMEIRYISSAINSFFVEERYKPEIHYNEELNTPEFRRTRAIELLIEELHELGIYLLDQSEGVLNDYDMEYVLELRKKFDKDNLFKLLSIFGEDNRCIVRDLVSSDIYDEMIQQVVEFFHQNLPLDSGWEKLAYYRDSYYCEVPFVNHVLAVLRKLENTTQDDEQASLAACNYVRSKYDHVVAVKEAAYLLLNKSSEIFITVDFDTIKIDLDHYDSDLLTANVVDKAVNNPDEFAQIYEKHVRESIHHIESQLFYRDGRIIDPLNTITPAHMILLVAELYNPKDQLDFEHGVDKLVDYIKDYPEIVAKFKALQNIIIRELYK